MTVAVMSSKCLLMIWVHLGSRKHLRGVQTECLMLMSPENFPLPDLGVATVGESLVQDTNLSP